MHAFTVASIAVMALTASAQSDSSDSTEPTKNLTIDAGKVLLPKKSGWCNAQKNSCDQLCPVNWDKNDCDAVTLVYNCTCTAPAKTPDMLQFMNTIPFFECQEFIEECVANTDNAVKQKACQRDNHCATKDPKDYKPASSGSGSGSSTASASAGSASGSASATASAATATASTKSDGGKARLSVGLMGLAGAALVAMVL